MAEIFTITLILIGILVVFFRPTWGLIYIIGLVYFPIFSIFNLGPIAISVSTLPVLGLFARSFYTWVRNLRKYPIPTWQWIILIGMAVSFILATFASSNLAESLSLLPNLIMYVMILFSVIILVRQPSDFLLIAKAILILILVDTLIPGLSPVGKLFGSPSMGINGVVFKYYPAFAIGLVILTQPVPGVSRGWKLVGGYVVLACLIRSILFETRAALLAMAIMVVLTTIRLPRRFILVGVILASGVFSAFYYGNILQKNFQETQQTLTAVQTANFNLASNGDHIRLVSLEFGREMFFDRPILGWGPETFSGLITQSTLAPRKYIQGGAFNSWLLLLVETGSLGFLFALFAFLIPIVLIWVYLGHYPQKIRYIVFAFALGALGTGIHLYFIDLLYTTQVWLHVGLCMAAVQVAVRQKLPKSIEITKLRYSHPNNLAQAR